MVGRGGVEKIKKVADVGLFVSICTCNINKQINTTGNWEISCMLLLLLNPRLVLFKCNSGRDLPVGFLHIKDHFIVEHFHDTFSR